MENNHNHKNIKISVLMSTYNGEQYIGEQLESLVNQTRNADEVVICDDGSNDSTVMLIKKFIYDHKLEGKWRLHYNDENYGWRVSFFKGIELTTGDVIFFADQDDIWYNDKIQVMSRIFIRNPQIDVVATSEQLWKSKRVELSELRNICKPIKEDFKIIELDKNGSEYFIHSSGCCMGVRRAYYEKVKKFYINIWAHDDIFWKLSVIEGKLAKISSSTILHRITGHNESLKRRTLDSSIQGCKNSILISKKIMEYIEENEEIISNCTMKKKVVMHKLEMEKERLKFLLTGNIRSFIKLLFLGLDIYRKRSQIIKDGILVLIH